MIDTFSSEARRDEVDIVVIAAVSAEIKLMERERRRLDKKLKSITGRIATLDDTINRQRVNLAAMVLTHA